MIAFIANHNVWRCHRVHTRAEGIGWIERQEVAARPFAIVGLVSDELGERLPCRMIERDGSAILA